MSIVIISSSQMKRNQADQFGQLVGLIGTLLYNDLIFTPTVAVLLHRLCLTKYPVTKLRIERIEIAAVQLFLGDPQSLAKPLIVNDLPLAQETNGVSHFWIFYQAQDVIIGGSGLLLCCQIFM